MDKTLFLIGLLFLTACYGEETLENGEPGHIICYSNEKIIFEGDSVARIWAPWKNDVWTFLDSSTGKLVHVSGQCVESERRHFRDIRTGI